MEHIDPKILEDAKRLYGENCELVKATEWSYTFKCGEKQYCSISRFMAEDGLGLSSSEFRRRWPSMSHVERLDFATNFHRQTWTENDNEILDVIMNNGDDIVWSSCALTLLQYPDRDRVVQFLLDRVKENTSGSALNYIQALGEAKDKRATSVIRPHYERLRAAMEQEAVTGVPDDIFTGPIPYHEFLSVAGDLYRIEGSQEYEQAIRKYFDHPNEQVRWWAEHALDVEGPTTAKRKAEYAKKRSKDIE